MKEKNTIRLFIILLGMLFLSSIPMTISSQVPQPIQVPQTINYQGYLEDLSGPVDEAVQMTFTIYRLNLAGEYSEMWTETHTAVQVSNGIYSVILGSTDPDLNPLNLPFDRQYFLGVTVGSDPEMTPLQPLTSVPYAMRAREADNALDISNNVVTSLKIFPGAVTSGKIASGAVGSGEILDGSVTVADIAPGVFNDGHSLDAADGSPVDAVYVNDLGNVGIGLTNPNRKLEVRGDTSDSLVYFENDRSVYFTGQQAVGFHARGDAFDSLYGTGVGGRFHGHGGSTSGNGFGTKIYALAYGSSNAYGVWSDATQGPTTGKEFAFYGIGDGYFSGNVGIGTTTPTRKLDVRKPSGFGDILVLSSGSVATHQFYAAGGDNGRMAMYDANGNVKIAFRTDGQSNINGNALVIKSSGNVGIGTASPRRSLDVNGEIIAVNRLTLAQDGGATTRTWHVDNHSGRFRIFDQPNIDSSGTERFTITTSGNVGIGTSNPLSWLHIKQKGPGSNREQGIRLEYSINSDHWNIMNGGSLYFSYNGELKGVISAVNGQYNEASDKRLKKNINPMGDILDKVLQLQPVRYHFKDNADDTAPKSIGFLAQDVEKYFPEVVDENNGIKALSYSRFAVLAIGAIKEQQKQIANLQAEVDALKVLLNVGQ